MSRAARTSKKWLREPKETARGANSDANILIRGAGMMMMGGSLKTFHWLKVLKKCPLLLPLEQHREHHNSPAEQTLFLDAHKFTAPTRINIILEE